VACRRLTGAGGGAPRGGDGVPVAGGQESGGEVARKLPWGDVVLVVCLAGAERRWSVGTTARPSGGGARAHRCGGPVDLVRENEIGRVGEHQCVAEPPELFRFKRTNHRYKGKMISNALQTEQPIGLSGHRPMQPRLHRIKVGYTHTR
jgi:hypothetical protein